MRLRTQITLLIAASLLSVLLLFNVVTYMTVVNISTKSELRLLWEATQPLMSQPGLYNSERWNRVDWLKPFLLPHAMLRIIDTNSQIKATLQSHEELSQIPAAFSNRSFSKTLRSNNTLIVYIQTPITDTNGQTLGALQVARKLDTLDEYLNVLVRVLMLTTTGATFFALFGGLYYMRLILRPIHQLAFIMETNQKSGLFEQMPLPASKGQDEFGQLIRTFNGMIGKLEHNFNQQKQFLADASHELKTPLTIIESYTDLLKRWGGNDAALREEALDAIQSEAARLRNLTDSLLTVASTETESPRIWKSFDMSDLVRTIGAALQQALNREVHIESELQTIVVYGDPEQMKQLIIILLDNAIKYSQQPVQMTLQYVSRDQDIVLLEVIDRGIGIEAVEIPRLFDRFYRVDQARSRETGGSGLGLAIARNIVRLHKGTISISSTPGAGTKVTVKLPIHRTLSLDGCP